MRIFGDSLDPEEISRILNCKPTAAHVKGQIRKKSTVYNTGGWLLEAANQEPCDLDRQVAELFSRVKRDIPAWASLSQEYEIDLCCGIFMEKDGEDIKISAETMKLLSERGIKLEISIYAPTPEVQMDAPCPCKSGKIYAECCAPKPRV
jgi:hypothetical protein